MIQKLKGRYQVKNKLIILIATLMANTATATSNLIFKNGFEIIPSVGLTIQSTSSVTQNDIPITFGQIFKPGEISAKALLAVRLVDGTQQLVPSQINKKATHVDGSLRHAVVTVLMPTLMANTSQDIEIVVVNSVPNTSPVQLSNLLNTSFTGEVSLDIAGTTYSASITDLLQNTSPETWLSGSEVSEWIVSAPLKTAGTGGTEHPHLTARFNIRAYAGFDSVRVDVIIENNWSYVPEPQNFTYDVAVSLCGNNVYSKTDLTHYHHARWRKTFWCGNEPAIHIKHDVDYLIDSYAVPNYDRTLVIPESDLADMETNWTGAKTEPMGIGAARAAMPDTGAAPDIGPLPRWSVRYILSQDLRAKTISLGTDNLAGSWSIHYRDKNTSLPVSLDDYPYMTIYGNSGDTYNPNTGMREEFPDCGGECATPFRHDSAHQPSFAYISYLVTGDYYYLEELQFWANYNMFESNPHYRGFEKGWLKWGQLRGQAWSLRTLGNAAYITPDMHALKNYFNERVDYNLIWYNDRYVNNPDANNLGIISNGYSIVYNSSRGTATWQEAFFTWSSGYMVELGFTEAQSLLNWKSQFPISLMTDTSFCWLMASSYYLNVRDSSSSAIYTTVSAIYEESIAANIREHPCDSQEMANVRNAQIGQMSGYAHSPTGYPANLQPALAVSVNSDTLNGLSAWLQFENRSIKPDYSQYPNFAIVPR